MLSAPPQTDVLRGGDLGGPSREKNLRDVYEAYGVWGICVAALPDTAHEDVAKLGKFGNRTYVVAKSDALAADGYLVIQEPGKVWPDALLVFTGGEPDDTDWEHLREQMCRGGQHPNPTYKGK